MKNISLFILFCVFTCSVHAQDTLSHFKDYKVESSKYIDNGIIQSDSATGPYPLKDLCFFKAIIISNYDELSTAYVTFTNVNTKKEMHAYTNDYGEVVFRIESGIYALKSVHAAYDDLFVNRIEIKEGEFRTMKILINDKPENK